MRGANVNPETKSGTTVHNPVIPMWDPLSNPSSIIHPLSSPTHLA